MRLSEGVQQINSKVLIAGFGSKGCLSACHKLPHKSEFFVTLTSMLLKP
jgi:hypothetical protein